MTYSTELANQAESIAQTVVNNGGSFSLTNTTNVYVSATFSAIEETCSNAAFLWNKNQANTVAQINEQTRSYVHMVCKIYPKFGVARKLIVDPQDSTLKKTVIVIVFATEGGAAANENECVDSDKPPVKSGPGGVELPRPTNPIEDSKAEPGLLPGKIQFSPGRVLANMIKNIEAVLFEIYCLPAKFVSLVDLSQLTRAEKKSGVFGIILLVRTSNIDSIDTTFTFGNSPGENQNRRRRRRSIENTGEPQDITFEENVQYSFFTEAITSDGQSVMSTISYPAAAPSSQGYQPGFCGIPKSCTCSNITEVTPAMINSSYPQYYGVGKESVNTSLISIGTWDREAVALLCKDAKCNASLLATAVSGIDSNITTIQNNIDLIHTAKINIRKSIDCHFNANGTRADMFDQYEALCSRMVMLKNSIEDLTIKKAIIEREQERCEDRSWLRIVLENMWHKG